MTQSEVLVKFYKELEPMRSELSELRSGLATFKNAHKAQVARADKQEARADKFEVENRRLQLELMKAQKEIVLLNEKLTNQKNISGTYAGIIFKPNIKATPSTKTSGAQPGHTPHNKVKLEPTEFKRVFLDSCPDCKAHVNRSDGVYTKTVEDLIPAKVVVTEYSIERQHCTTCKKEVVAIPVNTIPYLPYGTNIVGHILFSKYRLRLPLNKIQEQLKETYHYSISIGAIQGILHKTAKRNKLEYKNILQRVRDAPLKHADETGFRNNGVNGWAWMFATPEETYYAIKDTRGGGVVTEVLGNYPKGVLVRDDYAAYKNLDCPQQSCWSHILRVAKDLVNFPKSSKEIKELQLTLQTMFGQLKTLTSLEFNQESRESFYRINLQKLLAITHKKYKYLDAKKLQTRISNQFKENFTKHNLLTALNYSNVPLTNNHAERQIRPLAIIRKISGGCRSVLGAETLSVNLSVIQSLVLKKKNVFEGISQMLNSVGNVGVVG